MTSQVIILYLIVLIRAIRVISGHKKAASAAFQSVLIRATCGDIPFL